MKRGHRTLFVNITLLSIIVLAAVFLGVVKTTMAAPTSTNYINDYFGFSRSDLVSYLESHENDDYFIGTPYYSSPDVSAWPNGAPGPNGEKYMNCTGFVWYVMNAIATQNHSIIPCSAIRRNPDTYYSPTWAEFQNSSTVQGNVVYYDFSSKEEMLASGILEKGDIIWSYADLNNEGYDHHVGFFWGENSSDDKYWHSTSHANLVEQINSNVITEIVPKNPVITWRVYKLRDDYKVTVTKTSTDPDTGAKVNVAGARLRLRTEAGQTIEEWTSTTSPKEITGLSIGTTYVVEELSAPDGYVKGSSKTFTVEATTQEVAIEIENDYTKVRISKQDITNSQELPGATLQIENEAGDVVQLNGQELKWVSGNTPYEIEKLPVGTYYLRETIAPEGYILNQSRVKFEVKETGEVQTVTMKDDVTKIQVGKIDLNTGNYIAGATLRIIDQATGEVYLDNIVTTNEPMTITKVPVGTYILQEVAAPAGYVLNPTSLRFTVTNTGSVQQVFIKNNYTYVSIADQKISIDLSIAGFKLEIKNSAGEVVDSYTSDGKVHTTEELEVGRYTIEEVEAPAGYICYPTPIEVYVPEKGTVAANEIYFPNDYTKVQISKVDITTSEELPGAEIEIRNEDGEVVEKWTSSDTPHQIDRLPVGSYELVETIAPEGYQLQENSVQFEVLETGEIQSTVMYNEPKIEVPDTASQASVVTYICGIVIVLCGIGLVLYNVKEHKKKKKK